MKVDIKKLDYHRNGSGGNGFHVVSFAYTDGSEKQDNMVGVVFEELGSCAVFDADLLQNGIIEFGANSWRGDNFESFLRLAIKEAK